MNDEQKKKVENAQKSYKGVAASSKFISQNKKAVGFLGKLTGYEEETKNAIRSAEVINSGCEAVDGVNNRMRKA